MKKITKVILTLGFIAITLSGCSTPEQREANRLRSQQEAQVRQQNYMNSLANKCDGFGFKRGTPDFARCVQQEANRAESCQASTAAINQRVSDCQRQCYQSLNVMECNNRCRQVYGVAPNC
jgi:hypothetical protein